jgi:hypothetical protein
VRRRLEARIPLNGGRPLRNAGDDRRYPDDDPPAPPPPRWTYGPERPAIRIYEAPRYYIVRPRPAERWYSIEPGRYVEPGRYQEYRYPGDFTDEDPRDDYRRDDYRRDDYRRDDYPRRDDRADDDRRDGYRRYEYR